MRSLRDLLRRRPEGFDVRVEAVYAERLVFGGTIKTGDQLFANESVRETIPLVFHLFAFELAGTRYEFKVSTERARRAGYRVGERYSAFVKAPQPKRCWFDGHEHVVHTIQDDDGVD